MVWCGKKGALARAVSSGVLLGCCVALSAEEPDVDRWFSRHGEALWQPLVEKFRTYKAAMTSPVEKLTLPLDYYENGRIRAVLRAERAQLFPDGGIYAEKVCVEMLTADGQADGSLTAEGCVFDRKAKHGYCEGPVGMAKGLDRLKGRGMYFSTDAQFIKILAECEIRTRRIQNNFGRF